MHGRKPLPPADSKGVLRVLSEHPFRETVERLEGAVARRGAKVFARVDFTADARAAGLLLRPTFLLLFGSPRAGTPVLQARPTAALDLPLKIVVWEDDDGKVWLLYNEPEFLELRHALPPQLDRVLDGVAQIAVEAAGPAR
jgi:uncharacterized protein (DUF302 family)